MGRHSSLLIGSEDPKGRLHAARNLIRAAYGAATMRWNKVGYTTMPEKFAHADRDLFGFRGGTTTDAEDEDYMNRDVYGSRMATIPTALSL